MLLFINFIVGNPMSSLRYLAWRVVLLMLYVLATCPVGAEDATTGISLNTPAVWRVPAAETPDQKERSGSVLAMEMTRQAVLLAARDELGLRTLDPSLGEPAELAGILPIKLQIELVEMQGTHLKLHRSDQLLLEQSITVPWSDIRQILPMLVNHEQFSRVEAVQALRAAGLEGKPNLWRDSAPVPGEIQDHIDQMSLIPQFLAARQLHKLIGEDGESPERLWALSRVYANLAQECRWYIGCEYAVFQARSLLYAQRLRVKAPEHLLGHLSLSYALMMASYTNAMETHLKAMDKHLAALPAEQQPDWAKWVPLLRACFMYDKDALDGIVKSGGTLAPIAAFWDVYTNEFVDQDRLTFEALEKAIKVNPHSTRLFYSGYDTMGVRAGHWLTEEAPSHFSQITPRMLRQVRSAPPEVKALLDNLDGDPMSLRELANLGWALEDLTREGKDADELSFGVLGTLIGEANALHVLYRAEFLQNSLGVEANDYLDDELPLIDRHPFRLLIETFRFDKNSTEAGMLDLVKQFEPIPINSLNVSIFVYHIPDTGVLANGWEEDTWWQRCHSSGLNAGNELLYQVRYYKRDDGAARLQLARHMGSFDQHHPKRIALTLESPGLPEQRVEHFRANYSHHILVVDALATRLEKQGDLEAALNYAKQAAAALPEYKTLERQARLELALGDEERWLKLMKSILDQPDYALDHAFANKVIAETYMNAGRYEDALPYALESAGSGSYFGYECAFFAHAALGHYDKAEQFAQRIDRRYGDGEWYAARWHLWSGWGNINAALEDFHKLSEKENPGNPKGFSIDYSGYLIQADRMEEAMQLILARENADSFTTREMIKGLCLAHQLGQDKDRDRLLDNLINYPPKNGERLRFCLLGDIIKSVLDGGELDLKALADWHVKHDIENRAHGDFYLGWFLLASGEHELALPLLKPIATVPNLIHLYTLQARSILRFEGYDNEDMLPTGFKAGHPWPKPR